MIRKNRRQFLKEVGGLTAAAAAISGTGALGAIGANEAVIVGVIGTGGMGGNHVKELAARKDVRIACVCDPDANRLSAAAKATGDEKTQAVKDLRQVLDKKEVDAVWIATPDHWHGPAAILACEAKKHVYVEKPCAHNIREGRLMIEAARKNGRVMQVGTQSRSGEHNIEAMKLLREGVIGDILIAKAWNSQLRANIGHAKPSEAPKEVDYDLWVGPAPMVPFQSNRFHYGWHWWYSFGTGDMGNDGVHDLDVARWGLGVDTHPSTIAAIGGKYFFDDDQEFPDTQYVAFEYPGDGKVGGKRQLIYEHRIWSPYFQEGYENGNAFYGTKGMMILGKGSGWKVTLKDNKPGPSGKGSLSLQPHHTDFLDCIRSGKKPHADIEIGHLSAALCHLGNLATRVGRVIRFDPRSETIVGDDEAQKLISRPYREGHWAVPKGI